MDDSWSRWAGLNKEDGQSPTILAAHEMGRNMQLLLKEGSRKSTIPWGEPCILLRQEAERAFSEECEEFVTIWNKSSTGRNRRFGERRVEKEVDLGEKKRIDSGGDCHLRRLDLG